MRIIIYCSIYIYIYVLITIYYTLLKIKKTKTVMTKTVKILLKKSNKNLDNKKDVLVYSIFIIIDHGSPSVL